MAQALRIGERVKVRRGFRPKPDSPAYRQGLKAVRPDLVGEIAGPAPEGRAWLVSFNGIQVPVTKQNLVRVEEVARPSRGRRSKAEQPPTQQPDSEQPAPKRPGRPRKVQPVEQPSTASELGESGFEGRGELLRAFQKVL